MALILLLLIPIIAVVPLFIFGKRKYVSEKISVVSAFLEVIVGSFIIAQVVNAHVYRFYPYFSIDALSALFLGVTLLAGFMVTLYSTGYFQEELKREMFDQKGLRQAYLLIRLFMLFIYVAILTTSPVLMWIAIEATTLLTVFMINQFNRRNDVEAAWKFFVINSVGLLLGFLGTLMYIAQVGHLERVFTQWTDLSLVVQGTNPDIMKLAFIFVFIGYGTKMGIAPMHTWLPDAHSQAPSPMSSLLSGILINIAFLAILKFSFVTNSITGSAFTHNMFIFFGCISVIIAGSIIYAQKDYKRLLAYSTIEHAGLILMGIGFGGIAIIGSLFQMIYHSLAKTLFFLLSGNVIARYHSSTIADVRGMLKVLPITSILFIFAFLFLAGLPPFGIFFSKFYILLGGFTHHIIVTGIIILMLALVFIGFLRTTLSMLFTPPPDDIRKGEFNQWTIVPLIVLTAVLCVISVYIPDFLSQLLSESVNIIKNNTL